MTWWLYLIIAVSAVLVILIAVVIGRTLAFRPVAGKKPEEKPVTFDKEKAVNDLAAMVRLRTVSSRDKSEEDESEFEKFESLLFKSFPLVAGTCEFDKIGSRGLLFKWKGKSSAAPSVFMAHYDVVSAVEKDWLKPAFEGIVEDGVLWGRGTLDTKITLNGVMQAAEQLIKDGFIPENDIYLAFAGDEEIAGNGAVGIVDEFIKRGVKPALVVDEGGAVVEKVFPGVNLPCALIGTGEKGMMDLEFSVRGNGGHASAPPPHTAVGKLSAACVKVENKPFKSVLSRPAAEMFDTLGRHSSFGLRMVFANLWLFKPVLDGMCKKKGGELNALMRTTCAFTQMQGSKGTNVLPPEAKMVANIRIISGETTDSVIKRIEQTVADPDVKLRIIHAMNPSAVSVTEGEGWQKLKDAISLTWKGAIISPYLMVACSDSRHYGKISDKVYRFSAMALSAEERALIHGNNERVPLETVYKTVEFYLRLIGSC